MPVRRSGRRISIPLWIMKYKQDFYANFRFLGMLKISKGKEEVREEYKTIFEEAIRFSSVIKATKGEIVKKTAPYDFRIGKVKGKYIMDEVMPKREKARLSNLYEKHQGKNLEIADISLNDYLNTAAVCYRAAYEKARGLSPLEMYNRWADGRHGGMLDIKDFDSKEEFIGWKKGGKWVGSHPYEIVFSWHRHGIHLYPPDVDYGKPRYSLRVTNYAYAPDFIRMAKALIKNRIPFQARDLQDVLDFLSGEKYWTVNDYDDLRFLYIPSREYKNLYFKHIEWKELKIVRFK